MKKIIFIVTSIILVIFIGFLSFGILTSNSKIYNKEKSTKKEIKSSTVEVSKATTAPTFEETEENVASTDETEPQTTAAEISETEAKVSTDKNDRSSSFSASEREIIARLIMAESGDCSTQCLWLTGSAFLNLADYYNNGDLEKTAYDPQLFETAYSYYNQDPTQDCWDVTDRLISGDRDHKVMYFRMDYYHSFGTPYTNIDNVYFSTL